MTDSVESTNDTKIWRHGFRFFLLLICFCCLTSINANYLIINFTFICMKNDPAGLVDAGNGTQINVWDYTPAEKTLIHWSLSAGTIIGTFPVNWAYIKYGARFPFFIAGICSVISTLSLPLAVNYGIYHIMAARFIQGLAYSADFAAIGIMTVRWAPIAEMGFFISVMTIFTAVAPVITNPLTGMFCESALGWRSAYYFLGAFCAIIFTMWLIFYHDDPHLHRQVSSKELQKIQEGKTKNHIQRDSFVPYWDIIKNKTILVIWFNAFVEMTTITVIIQFAPLYFESVLRFGVAQTAFLTALTAFTHIPTKVLVGYISDKLNCVNERLKMCMFNTVAVGIAGVMCLGIGVFPPSLRDFSVIAFGGVFTAMSINPGGFYKCAAFVSRQYAHFVIATIQFTKCLALFVSPGVYKLFVSDDKHFDQWRWVYISHGAFLIVANFMFYFVATDQPASFTEITRETREKEKEAKAEKIVMKTSKSQ